MVQKQRSLSKKKVERVRMTESRLHRAGDIGTMSRDKIHINICVKLLDGFRALNFNIPVMSATSASCQQASRLQ